MLTIGQMSKVCSVSVKTLHHYDKIGLLKPLRIDSENGYRYYDDSQIGTMLLIGRMKRYGFSLSFIQQLLKEGDQRRLLTELRRQRIRLDRQLSHLSVVLHDLDTHLEEFERTGDIMSYQNQYVVELKESEEQVFLTLRKHMSVEEFGTCYGTLYEKIAREHLQVNGVVAAIYHDKEFDPASSDIEVAVGIQEREKATVILPPRQCAVTVHKGPYSALPDAYGAIVSWLNANGYEIGGAPYEIYRKAHFDGLPPQEWVTEIFFPVR